MRKIATIILISVIIPFSCSKEQVQTERKKTSWSGKARIVSIGKKGESSSGNIDYLEVRFYFIPDDPSAPEQYLAAEEPDRNRLLFYDNRYELHKNWISKWGLKTGNEYRAVRHENILNSKGHRAAFEVLLEPR